MFVVFVSAVFSVYAQTAEGPLTVHSNNPRYFNDGSGKAVYLSGHQIFVDVQDNPYDKEFTYNWQREIDWTWYLNFARERDMNFIRNWSILSTGAGASSRPLASPMPYLRVSGYGTANDGGNKFNLNHFNQGYFDRLRSRVIAAGERGIYVSIMLFEVYGFSNYGDTLWQGNVFNGDNNMNGIDVDYNNDQWGMEFFYTNDSEVLNLQKEYVRKVIDTVNDLDNIFYEIANELGNADWQYDMINFVNSYQAGKPKQHLVMMSGGGRIESGGWSLMTKSKVVNSGSDCFAVSGGWADYKTNPPVDNSGIPAFMDMDHIDAGGPYCKSFETPWKAFTRGYHYILYDHPFEDPGQEDYEWDRARYNTGAVSVYANKFQNLSEMNPSNSLSSTTYCLASPGSEYLVYQPLSGAFTVNLIAGTYDFEWFNPVTSNIQGTGTITATTGNRSFTPPFSNDAVLYLCLDDDHSPDTNLIPQTDWSLIYTDSQELVGENGAAVNAFDGNPDTFWHTEWRDADPAHPHEIQIGLGDSYDLSGLKYLPRQDGCDNGRIRNYEIYTSTNGSNWDLATSGTFADNANEQEIGLSENGVRYIRLRSLSAYDGDPWATAAEINLMGTLSSSSDSEIISQSGWSLLYADSEEIYRAATNAFDGNPDTFWHTEWRDADPAHPHEIQIGLGDSYDLSGLKYLPRQDGCDNGRIRNYEIYTSTNGSNWDLATSGTFADNANEQEIGLSENGVRYIRLRSLSAYDGDPWATAAEINLMGTLSSSSDSEIISQSGWSLLYVDSEEIYRAATNAFDGICIAWEHVDLSIEGVRKSLSRDWGAG